MDQRVERVVVETDRHRITGDLTLPREGHRSRLSDFLNRGDLGFLAFTDVEIAPLDDAEAATRRPFLAVARAHVELVYPADG